jgi:hypothetical protein
MFWVNRADAEVSGFGSLDYDEQTKTFTPREVILLKQTVSGSDTEMDASAIGKAMFLLRDEPNALKWHWHSHVRMGVFWSSTDMDLIRQLGSQGWLLASVFNQKEEVRTAFYETVQTVQTSFIEAQRRECFIDEIPTTVILNRDPALVEAWIKEFDDNVTEKKYSAPVPSPSGYIPPGPSGTNTTGTAPVTNIRPGGTVATYHSERLKEFWNDFGYAEDKNDAGRFWYNPCFDSTVGKSQDKLFAAMDEMSGDEVDFCLAESPTFKRTYETYLEVRTQEVRA